MRANGQQIRVRIGAIWLYNKENQLCSIAIFAEVSWGIECESVHFFRLFCLVLLHLHSYTTNNPYKNISNKYQWPCKSTTNMIQIHIERLLALFTLVAHQMNSGNEQRRKKIQDYLKSMLFSFYLICLSLHLISLSCSSSFVCSSLFSVSLQITLFLCTSSIFRTMWCRLMRPINLQMDASDNAVGIRSAPKKMV